MKKKFDNICYISVLIVAAFLTCACSINHNIRGRVVDAETGKPIEGASIAIRWVGYKFGPPYSSGEYILNKSSDISDSEGYFEVPKYYFKSVYLGVYKKGYVCWHNRKVFLKGIELENDDRVADRVDFKIKNGMVVNLERFTDDYPRAFHSSFVVNISRVSGGLKGIGDEVKFYRKHYWNK